jgi:hypothetical protein
MKKTCPVCSGCLSGNHFEVKVGKPIPAEFYAAKVCQFSKKPGCINKEYDPTLGYSNPWESAGPLHPTAVQVLKDFDIMI